MIWAVPLLVVVGAAAGPVLANIHHLWLRRLASWLLLATVIMGADSALSEYDSISRMVGICCVLLGAMKGLVYAEWAGKEQLTILRYGVFASLWFGMDPASFQTRRVGLSWKSDVKVGLLLMLVGTLGAWLVWAMEWRQILIMCAPMSLGFHVGMLALALVMQPGRRRLGIRTVRHDVC